MVEKTIEEIRRIHELAKFLELSESYVEDLTSKEITEKIAIKLIKEGYTFGRGNNGGWTFYKDY